MPPFAGAALTPASGGGKRDAGTGALCEERHIHKTNGDLPIGTPGAKLGVRMNRYAFVFLASLVLLSSTFAAVPRREFSHAPTYGYDDAVSGAQGFGAMEIDRRHAVQDPERAAEAGWIEKED